MARTRLENVAISNSSEPVVGVIREEDFSMIMSQAFAAYGLSVMTDRALLDACSRLKLVQMLILPNMNEAR